MILYRYCTVLRRISDVREGIFDDVYRCHRDDRVRQCVTFISEHYNKKYIGILIYTMYHIVLPMPAIGLYGQKAKQNRFRSDPRILA